MCFIICFTVYPVEECLTCGQNCILLCFIQYLFTENNSGLVMLRMCNFYHNPSRVRVRDFRQHRCSRAEINGINCYYDFKLILFSGA